MPMEIGLYPTPASITSARPRSTACRSCGSRSSTASITTSRIRRRAQLQQNVTLPGNQVPQIQQSSLVGEVYRYQVVGPAAFRPDQSAHGAGLDRAAPALDDSRRRANQQLGRHDQGIRSRGGSAQAEAYNVTVPQLITALGNANINVGGREISVGQQSVNIRGVGLIDDGGNDDLTKGYRRSTTSRISSFSRPMACRCSSRTSRGLRRLRAAARHRRARSRRRRRGLDRRHGAHAAHQ
jgi:heavy metal efflux system protein